MEFVNVIVDISSEQLDRVFLYRVPKVLQDRIQIGMQVQIPFGRSNRQRKGYVVGMPEEANYPLEKIKEISGIVKGSIKAESQLIALAAWMRENYGSTMNQALKTVLPVKQKTKQKQSRKLVFLLSKEEGRELLETYRKKHYQAKVRLLEALLEQGELDGKKAEEVCQVTSSVIQKMEQDGVLRVETATLYRNPFEGHFQRKTEMLLLNPQQQQAVEGIWEDYQRGIRKTYLLH